MRSFFAGFLGRNRGGNVTDRGNDADDSDRRFFVPDGIGFVDLVIMHMVGRP